MCYNILRAVNKTIDDLKTVRNEYFYALKDNVQNDSFINICEKIKNENKILSASIFQRQNSKYQRVKISNFNHHRQNRRFRRSKRRYYNQERKIIHKPNEKLVIEQAKAFCPDQKAINFTKQELTYTEKSLLRKGASFIPNQIDINWFNLKHNFDDFFNKLRYMATK